MIELQNKYEQIVVETKKKIKILVKGDERLQQLFGSLSQKAFAGEL
ncbi:MAG: hypothetical protein KAG45_04710 [Methyloprofundus sp.]|nr:hypothetical protein [Methyloprofundus sp.]